MGLRFYKRMRICPGLSLNLSGSGPSLTMGVRGAHVTVGRRGVTKTLGLPGTGVFYTSREGWHSGYHSAYAEAPRDPTAQSASDRVAEVVLFLFVVGVIVAFWLAVP
jgi:hypothetical protein